MKVGRGTFNSTPNLSLATKVGDKAIHRSGNKALHSSKIVTGNFPMVYCHKVTFVQGRLFV